MTKTALPTGLAAFSEAMAVPRVLPAALGSIAVVATTAIVVVHCVLAHALLTTPSSVRSVAIASAVFEAVVLVLAIWLLATNLRPVTFPRRRRWPAKFDGIWFGLALLLCVVAATCSVATLVCLSNANSGLPAMILGSKRTGFLVGGSVALGLSFATQLIFLVVRYVLGRMPHNDQAQSGRAHDEARRQQSVRVKSIPYSQTSSPRASKTRNRGFSLESRTPPSSSGGRSVPETVSSIRSSLSHVVRPISSKTRLLSNSQRFARRAASVDSSSQQDRSSVEDGFDSWDTSSVDPNNRQTVMETTSPVPARFLETIPASPTTSRSPSPGTPLDLEPPRQKRRSRSYSPANSLRGLRVAYTQQATSEAHIHPLFRSDSPTPPPNVTPGTMVVAAPNAGQIITDRQSVRTLSRMRSGSLPAVPSPLSRHGSVDDFHHPSPRLPSSGRCTPSRGEPKRGRRATVGSPDDTDETDEELGPSNDSTQHGSAAEPGERKMTPPIPEWILSAGSRTSLTGYNSRKLRTAAESAASTEKADDESDACPSDSAATLTPARR